MVLYASLRAVGKISEILHVRFLAGSLALLRIAADHVRTAHAAF